MANCFIELADEIKDMEGIDEENKLFRDQKVESLRELAHKSVEFGTIDTYAKYLYLLDQEKLADLKNTLIFFFLSEQIIKKKFDKRALIFLTTILQYQQVFPSNIKILTWNYDFQIQTAALQFKEEQFNTIGTSGWKHSPPLISYFPYSGYKLSEDPSLIHLNGIAGYYQNDENTYDHFFNQKDIPNYNSLLSLLRKLRKNVNRYLSFAWEGDVRSNMLEIACRIVENTNVLVVIGYSFPFFNREIDKELFEVFKRNNELKKIYFQDPFNDGQFLRNQFGLNDTIEILHVKNVKNYYVPMEL